MKYWKLILRIVQGILWAGAMVMGIGNMPSGFGGCFLLLAIFLTPRKVMCRIWEHWDFRIVFLLGLIFYFSNLPPEDVSAAAGNFVRILKKNT